MSVPKGLEALLANFVMGCGIHQQHAQKHDMSCNSSGLRVVNLKSGNRSNLVLFNVEKAGFC